MYFTIFGILSIQWVSLKSWFRNFGISKVNFRKCRWVKLKLQTRFGIQTDPLLIWNVQIFEFSQFFGKENEYVEQAVNRQPGFRPGNSPSRYQLTIMDFNTESNLGSRRIQFETNWEGSIPVKYWKRKKLNSHFLQNCDRQLNILWPPQKNWKIMSVSCVWRFWNSGFILDAKNMLKQLTFQKHSNTIKRHQIHGFN